jgi:hypothetical protein
MRESPITPEDSERSCGVTRCRAAVQVRHAAGAQACGDGAETLMAGREEPPKAVALAHLLKPCLPLFGIAPQKVGLARV